MRRVVRTEETVLLERQGTQFIELLEHMDSGGQYRRYVVRAPGKKDVRTPYWAGRRMLECIGQGELF